MKTIFQTSILCAALLGVSACTMEQISTAINTVEKWQATRFYSDKFPLRMPIVLHEKNTTHSDVFQVKNEGIFYAHLVFHLPDWQKSEENNQLYTQLQNIMLKFNNHQDFPDFNPKLLANEEIHAKIAVQNVDTGQIIINHQIDLKGIMKEQYIAFNSPALEEMAIKVSPNHHFALPKGRYRLIVENQHESTAYQPYQPRLQFAAQLPNWL